MPPKYVIPALRRKYIRGHIGSGGRNYVNYNPTGRRYKVKGNLPRRVARLENHVNPVSKYQDVSVTLAVPNVFNYQEFTSIQGETILVSSGDSIRSQNSIHLNNLSLDFSLFYNTATTFTSVLTRIIIFKWDDNTLPQDFDVLDYNQVGGPNVFAFYNRLNKHRYKILYDDKVVLGSQALSNIPFQKHWRTNIKLGWVCDFASTTASSGKGGRVFMIVLSEDTGLNPPHLTVNSRLTFEG
jgi:hypothetical protein